MSAQHSGGSPRAASIPAKLILASGSPRRKQLLTAAGYKFEIVVPSESAECGVCSGETPPELVARLAYQKAADVSTRVGPSVIIACDTICECQGQLLGKPRDEDDARRMLNMLSNRRHRVYSGLCIWHVPAGEPNVRVDETTLRMDLLSQQQIDDIVASGAWEGKAGAFGYQDGLDWVHVERGSETNVVGLPMELLAEMLSALEAS
ncbi:MAG TPA: Maf family protein [Pirellulales bacterium]|nr:Maf family protein [Pirellulales bacterium]